MSVVGTIGLHFVLFSKLQLCVLTSGSLKTDNLARSGTRGQIGSRKKNKTESQHNDGGLGVSE